jgi:hypothetical protein
MVLPVSRAPLDIPAVLHRSVTTHHHHRAGPAHQDLLAHQDHKAKVVTPEAQVVQAAQVTTVDLVSQVHRVHRVTGAFLATKDLREMPELLPNPLHPFLVIPALLVIRVLPVHLVHQEMRAVRACLEVPGRKVHEVATVDPVKVATPDPKDHLEHLAQVVNGAFAPSIALLTVVFSSKMELAVK